jgi:hypothetical protein
MAEKHKSKYKAPNDLEKSQKPKARKDLKDYTTDDKKGKMNPKSNGDTIPNLLRKTDKPFVDDGTYDIKWNADDRLYDDLENGDYDPWVYSVYVCEYGCWWWCSCYELSSLQ